ncbi:Lrp/AsnC family transcriptional regulator [Psychrobacillus psychrodurans]|uniref:Lrp/AsnC family transcriptional regulator n=1 Tax=Psychrobacillus psychrodurans TaxID=126157 RepID=UPI0008EF0C7C|nr:Lrp/AsnC family transcriptional regulator [Psychrobacillus psychrodurans]MCZ8540693.1 Lrp/AsnC family transcriptional regulator [Psychrobacillus psychrodurans]SFM73351.1 Lrp/AsnC family transcriptional regulator, leucine-responsive regulatory protein [Psychrobacillus psychrodurans]
MIDNTDMRILNELSMNSRLTMKELGKKVHLTGPAVSTRVAKLEEQGVIEGYSIKVNQVKLGYFVHAFITIITESTYHQPYLSFIKMQKQYIINNYKISGDGCYLLECKFPSNEILNDFLNDLNEHANYKLSIIIDI